MSVDLLRIDDRLVHGQVVEGWVRVLRIQRLVVASDAVAADEMQRALFCLAVPQGVELACLPVADAAARWVAGAWKDGKTLVLVANPEDALRLIEAGAPIRQINVGGMHFRDGRQQVLKAISVDEDDLRAFRRLRDRSVALEARPLPLEEPIDLTPYLDQWSQAGEQPR